jgi:hypothetical protein
MSQECGSELVVIGRVKILVYLYLHYTDFTSTV